MAFLTGNGILDKILKLRYAAMNSCVRFEVPTVVLVKIQMLLDVMLCCGAHSITSQEAHPVCQVSTDPGHQVP